MINASGPLGSTDYPWSMFHYDSLRTGTTAARGPSNPTLMWSYLTGAEVYASPAVSDGLAFIPSWDGNLYVIDENSGQLKWSYNTGAPIYSSPAISAGTVFLASRNGILYAFNEQSGNVIWSYANINYPITSSPLVANGKVFFGNWCSGALCNPAGHFVALDASTGTLLWPAATVPSAAVVSSPSIDNGHVFFGEDDGTVVSLNETTGKAVWSVVPGGTVLVRTAPAVANGKIFLGTGSGFIALDENTGATKWTFNTGGANATSAAVSNGIVYFGTGKGHVEALNTTSGAPKWSSAVSAPAGISSSPALSLGSGVLYFGANDNYLYALNVTNCNRVWRYSTSAPIFSSPAIADGRAFFGSLDKSVYAVGPVVPKLQVSISANPSILRSGEVSTLTTTVTNSSAPVSGAALAFSSSIGGSFTQQVMNAPGIYVSNFTAPAVTSSATTLVTVTASKAGFVSGSGQTSIMLNPIPTLTVVVIPRPTTVSPGGRVLLDIKVSNGTESVSGATINFTSSGGGGFSTPVDNGNGNYTATFNAPTQNSSPTITIQATKPGFVPGQSQVTVVISGVPDLTSITVAGMPLVILLAVFVIITVLLIVAVAHNRKSDRSQNYDQRPAY
jgi:eukaryotic-like serine/threonine-protein kinase